MKHTSEEVRRSIALAAIHEALRPFMDAVIREHAMRTITDPQPGDYGDAKAWSHIIGALALLDGASFGETRRRMKAAKQAFLDPEPPALEEAEAHYQELLSQETLFIVRTWLDTLVYGAEGYPNDVAFTSAPGDESALGTLLPLSRLDDSMLPSMDEIAAAIFAESCAATHAGVRGVREALAALRKSLPGGKRLPDEVVAFLSVENISLTP